MADLEQLKQKYAPVLRTMEQVGARLDNLNLDNSGKLFIRATAPSQQAANKIWDTIKQVDPNAPDLIADIQALAGGADAAGAAGAGGMQSYTVKPGDTLSKLAKQFYGDANAYMDIFNANKDKLKDPDKIQVGQELKIPQR